MIQVGIIMGSKSDLPVMQSAIDILQELEGPPYYGSLHTAELLTLILEKLHTHYNITSSIKDIVKAFGGNDNMQSALSLHSPIESFLICGANWKPNQLNLCEYYYSCNKRHKDAILLQFYKWQNDSCHFITYNDTVYLNKINKQYRFGINPNQYILDSNTQTILKKI